MENSMENSDKTFTNYNKGFILLSKVEQTNLYINFYLIITLVYILFKILLIQLLYSCFFYHFLGKSATLSIG